MPRNPMRHPKVVELLPPPRSKAGKKVIIHLSQAEAEKMLKCSEVEAMRKVRYVLWLTSGVRAGELFGLRLQDLLLDAPIPNARVMNALALEGFDGPNTLQDVKTEDGRRDLPLQPLMVVALKWWLEVGWVRWVGRKPTPEDFVFANELGKGYRPKAAQDLRRDLAQAGCSTTYEGHDLTAHVLRRSFSTMLDEVAQAHLVKSDLMGHSAVGVDPNHCVHISLDKKRRAIIGIVLDVTLEDITNGERRSDDEQLVVPEAAE